MTYFHKYFWIKKVFIRKIQGQLEFGFCPIGIISDKMCYGHHGMNFTEFSKTRKEPYETFMILRNL